MTTMSTPAREAAISDRMEISLRSYQWDLVARALRHLSEQANLYGADPVVQVCRRVVMARCTETLMDLDAYIPNVGKL